MRNYDAETKFLIIYNSVSEENKRDIMKEEHDIIYMGHELQFQAIKTVGMRINKIKMAKKKW